MNSMSRRSAIRGSLGLAATGALARPGIANAAGTTAGVSRDWGDRDGIDITDRALAGWGTVDGSGFCRGPASLMWFPAVVGHCGNGVIPPISGQSLCMPEHASG